MKNPEDVKADADLERMNEALKAALKTPPRKHKDEPKRRTRASQKSEKAS
jgi:hypothetical protein